MKNEPVLKLPYIRVSQKGATFYLSKAKASDLRNIVDFHYREPYRDYSTNYEPLSFRVFKAQLEKSSISMQNEAIGRGIQRMPNGYRVRQIKDYIEGDPEALLPSTVLLAVDTSKESSETYPIESSDADTGIFTITQHMNVSVIDGQHRLAGLFLANDETLKQIEVPVVFLIDVSVPMAAKLFQNINGKQQPVNKSVIYDLFGDVPEDKITSEDDRETKVYHTVCVSLHEDPHSPLYRQIKMLGVGNGAVSQSFFINTCKKELKCLKGKDAQERFNIIYDYFTLVQSTFPEDWPKPPNSFLDSYSEKRKRDELVDSYSQEVLKNRKSQLAKTNGITAILRLYQWLYDQDISQETAMEKLRGFDWTRADGTGAAAQTNLFTSLKERIQQRL